MMWLEVNLYKAKAVRMTTASEQCEAVYNHALYTDGSTSTTVGQPFIVDDANALVCC